MKSERLKNWILVTGGTGYIGRHIVQLLLKKGLHVLLLVRKNSHRDLSWISEEFRGLLKVVIGDICNEKGLEKIMDSFTIDSVIHCAALANPQHSYLEPAEYYHVNVGGTIVLLKQMKAHRIKKLIFASTAAVYGAPAKLPVNEGHALEPISPYGKSKKIAEDILHWYGKAYDFSYVILRGFNVCGVDLIGGRRSLKEKHHLIESAVRGAFKLEQFELLYAKSKTKDGTPIRDYVDVSDLAESYVRAVAYLNQNSESQVLNIASGRGYSMEEVVSEVERQSGTKLKRREQERKSSDVDVIYGSMKKANHVLGWKPKLSLAKSIGNTLRFYRGLITNKK